MREMDKENLNMYMYIYAIMYRKTVLIPENDEESTHTLFENAT